MIRVFILDRRVFRYGMVLTILKIFPAYFKILIFRPSRRPLCGGVFLPVLPRRAGYARRGLYLKCFICLPVPRWVSLLLYSA